MSIGGVSYTYNVNGIRTGKVVNGVTYTYQVEGSKILNEQYGATTITPIYDNEDSVCGILHNETPLFFLKNLQGDVIAITNKQGEVLARYTYDAWGKVLSVTNASGVEITAASHIAHQNPYRYRGYYYDIDTELYYLQSRYYDPAVGRFINADDAQFLGVSETVLGYNLLAYCENDPVKGRDRFGYGKIDDLLDVLGKSVDVLQGIIEMLGQSSLRDAEKILKDVIKLTNAKKKHAKKLKALQKETDKLARKLKGVGLAIIIIGIVTAVYNSYKIDGSALMAVGEFFVDVSVAFIEHMIVELFEWIVGSMPYVKILVGILGSWLVSYLVKKYLTKTRVKRIKKAFVKKVKSLPTTLSAWISAFIRCLTT